MAPTFPPKLYFAIPVHQISRFVTTNLEISLYPLQNPPSLSSPPPKATESPNQANPPRDSISSSSSSLLYTLVSPLWSRRLSGHRPPNLQPPTNLASLFRCSQLSLSGLWSLRLSPVTAPQIPNPQQVVLALHCSLVALPCSGPVRFSCTISVRASAPLGSQFVLSFSPLFDLCSVVLCSHSFRASLCLIGEFSLSPSLIPLVFLVSLVSPSLSGLSVSSRWSSSSALNSLSLWSLRLLLGDGSPSLISKISTAHVTFAWRRDVCEGVAERIVSFMKDCYMIVSLIAVIDVSAHAVAARFCVHNGIRWTQRWIHGVYGVALVSPLVIEENGAFPFKTHLTMETEIDLQKFTAKIVDMMKQEKLYASQGGPIILSQKEMQKFTAKIVDMMKQEKLYASQGGPIITSQIQNEYGNVNSACGAAVKPYIKWPASMATSLDIWVPWVMRQQSDAPDPVIHTASDSPAGKSTYSLIREPGELVKIKYTDVPLLYYTEILSMPETELFHLYSVSNQKRNQFSVPDRISDDVFRDGNDSVFVPFLIAIRDEFMQIRDGKFRF
ncbi:hypothetical protein Syun_025303 [Stephania yunnanensis]|uniref:beta-galactosidase n=1 Tax=Stephania yunnanensis TaxID=152371 RepID=A0AAP0EYK6_9MAGN